MKFQIIQDKFRSCDYAIVLHLFNSITSSRLEPSLSECKKSIFLNDVKREDYNSLIKLYNILAEAPTFEEIEQNYPELFI